MYHRLLITLASCVVSLAGSVPLQAAEKPPNVLLIMADDLGFSDLGCYGGEIETPHLDALAGNGLRFTQFYNTARCWPTRAALLTGYYAQQVRRDIIPGVPKGVRSGGRGQRPTWAQLLPAMLGPAGYRSYHSGKWHIDGMPLKNGFDRSYYLGDQGRFFSPRVHFEDDERLPAVERGTGYYATNAITDHAIRCLEEHAEQHAGKPFFHYLAYTAPHFPLHALPEDIDRYRERYRRSWAKVRKKRWERLQKIGIVKGRLSDVERDLGPPYHFPEALKQLGPGEVNRPLPWKDLTEEQREFQSTKMAIHAAMIDRMDRGIGRVLDQLRKMKAFDNTLILFLSDNGCSAEIMVRNDGHDPKAPLGSAATHLCLGPGWSTTCNTPFRRHKTWVHEGGCATPLIAHWPSGIRARGELRHTAGHVIDIVPTILELAGTKRLPADAPAAPGKSLVQALGKDVAIERDSLWWLHDGHRAIRKGDWKLVVAKGEQPELFNLRKDRTETRDLAARYPDKARQLAAEWDKQLVAFRALALRDRKDRPAPNGSKTKPNVVLIFADDQGYQDLGVFGSPNIKTPNVDRMAGEGMRFTDFYSAASVCTPSRAALMTGCYPERVGRLGVLFPRDKIGLNPSEMTIAELLKTRGYATACIGKWHLGHKQKFLPTNHGFDTYFGIPYSNDMGADPAMQLSDDIRWRGGFNEEKFRQLTPNNRRAGPPLFRGTRVVEFPVDQNTLTKRYTEEAVRFITANKDKPFFVYLPHTMPHIPLYATPEFSGKSAAGLYGDTIEEMDWSVGQIMATLKKLKLDRNTLVIYTSDNGPWNLKGNATDKVKGNKNRRIGGSALPLRGYKFQQFEGGMREPTVMWWPGRIPAGSVCREVAGTIDILPTLAAITGAALPRQKIDGHNILPLLEGRKDARSPHKAYFYQSKAVRIGEWKLLESGPRNKPKRQLLFNLASDIGEKNNVAADHPDVVKRLSRALSDFKARMKSEGRPRGSL